MSTAAFLHVFGKMAEAATSAAEEAEPTVRVSYLLQPPWGWTAAALLQFPEPLEKEERRMAWRVAGSYQHTYTTEMSCTGTVSGLFKHAVDSLHHKNGLLPLPAWPMTLITMCAFVRPKDSKEWTLVGNLSADGDTLRDGDSYLFCVHPELDHPGVSAVQELAEKAQQMVDRQNEAAERWVAAMASLENPLNLVEHMEKHKLQQSAADVIKHDIQSKAQVRNDLARANADKSIASAQNKRTAQEWREQADKSMAEYEKAVSEEAAAAAKKARK
jgi:hypothetical protein